MALKRKINNRHCCVDGCNSKYGHEGNVSFHYFPRKGERKVSYVNELGITEKVDKLTAWVKQVQAKKEISKYMAVCSLHFKKEDYIISGVPIKRQRLKLNAVPTINLPIRGIKIETDHGRYAERLYSEETVKSEDIEIPEYTEEDVTCAKSMLELANIKNSFIDLTNSFVNLIDTDHKLKILTGLSNFKVLTTIMELYDAKYPDSKSDILSTKEKIIMICMKIKLNISYTVIAILFKNVTKDKCESIFTNTINKLYPILEECVYWPSKQKCQKNTPTEEPTKIESTPEIVRTIKVVKKPLRKIGNKNCCIDGCFSRYTENRDISFHRFPQKGERKVPLVNEYGVVELVDRRIAWLKRINTEKVITKFMTICCRHFKKDDFILPDVPTKRKHLKANAVPSLNLPLSVLVIEADDHSGYTKRLQPGKTGKKGKTSSSSLLVPRKRIRNRQII